MVTCQLSELDWEVTVELPADFLSLGRGSVIEPVPIKEQNIGKHRYIDNWILRIYKKYRWIFLQKYRFD